VSASGRRYRRVVLLSSVVVVLLAQAPCGAGQRVAMQCAVKKKVLAVCATPQEGAPTALQYRFGPAGKPELVFPKDPDDSLSRFKMQHRVLISGTVTTLSFVNAGVAYEVFVQDGRDAGGGVNVRGADGKTTLVSCTGPVVQKWDDLGPFLEIGDLERAVMMDRCRRAASGYADHAMATSKGQMDGVQQGGLFEAAEALCREGWAVAAAECAAAKKFPCGLTADQQKALDAKRAEVLAR
jgi:hypothetical protein